MMEFEHKVALVTGAGSGMGRAVSLGLAARGATVAVTDIAEGAGEETVRLIEESGGTAIFRRLDVANAEDVARTIPGIAAELGGLHLAVNNAGVEGAHVKLAEIPADDFRRVVNINLEGVFHCLKAEIPLMLGSGGAIVNTASASGLIGGYNLAAYTAAKHGVIGLTKAAAMDYGDAGVRVNAVCPGPIDTPFIGMLSNGQVDHLLSGTPMGRLGRVEEVTEAILWLLSPRSSYVLGHALAVDGGTVLGGVTTNLAAIG